MKYHPPQLHGTVKGACSVVEECVILLPLSGSQLVWYCLCTYCLILQSVCVWVVFGFGCGQGLSVTCTVVVTWSRSP